MTLRTLILSSLIAVCAFAQDSAAFLANYDEVTKKLVSLAEAVPAEKFSWKPADGVRSIGQVYVHLAGANLMIPNALGAKSPAGIISRDAEKTMTEKSAIIGALKQSIAHARDAMKAGLEQPSKATKLFGREATHGSVALLMISHLHEHLGQSIAYARSVGVTPPWSAGRE